MTEPEDALVQLRARVDAHFEAAVARSPDAFQCAAGCSRCCARFSVYAVEARRLRRAIESLPASTRRRIRDNATSPEREAWCPLLVDERCSVYGERPMICRSHGLPVLADGSVDHCPLNFVGHRVPAESVLRLAAVDAPLAVIAELHASGAPRVEIVDLALAATELSGSA